MPTIKINDLVNFLRTAKVKHNQRIPSIEALKFIDDELYLMLNIEN